MKLAVWSGPRNISTAMMYAFAQRADCAVVDEPFYAAYLHLTGLNHPMRDAVLASQPTDPKAVIAQLTGPNPRQMPHFYQKHMAQHMVPGVPRDWLADVTNIFLIRHPTRVVASFSAKYENPTLDDLGFVQQAELFDHVQAMGQTPIVIDSTDIRANPEHMLTALCDAVGLHFDPAMLTWPKGGNAADGVWAAHWYGAVHGSTGFAGAEGAIPVLSGRNADLAEAAMPAYDQLRAFALKP